MIRIALVVFGFALSGAAAAQQAAARVALVIGNGAYGEAPLRNPANDARAIGRAIERLGFRVSMAIDANRAQMERAIVAFTTGLDESTTSLFYYAGHGVQSRGRNYLLPVDAKLDSEAALRFEAIDVAALVEEMGLARSKVSFVILDACRNNPFERRFRGASRGLAAIDAASGTMIAYATAPGSVAADGDGENGLYTSDLLHALQAPGLKAGDVFKRVRIAVSERSNGRQVPWESSSLTGDFVFNPPTAAAATAPAAPAPAASAQGTDQRLEASFWESVRDTGSAAAYEEYLRRFPLGTFAGLARIRLEELRGAAPRQGGGPACADLSGAWRILVPKGVCKEAVFHLKRTPDGYSMRQDDCLGATSSARVKDRSMVIDWQVPLCSGRTEVDLNPGCTAGSGEVIMPANFLLCAGRFAATLQRLSQDVAQ